MTFRTKIAGVDVLVIDPEPPGKCDYCGGIAELRPYGEDGQRICYPCAMKPEHIEETKYRMNQALSARKATQ